MLGQGGVYVADKGFLDFAHYLENKCQLVTPPRAFNNQQRLTVKQIQIQLEICKKRIPIERVFGAIKRSWRHFDRAVPITEVDSIDVESGICAHLTAVMRSPFVARRNTGEEPGDSASVVALQE